MFKTFKKIISNKYAWLFLSQLVILWVSAINIFPKGYVLSGGDVYQFVNIQRIWPEISMTWANFQPAEGVAWQFFGYGIYIYIIQAFSSLFRLSVSEQSFFGYSIFLLASFWLFYYSLSLIKNLKLSYKFKIIFSLIYTFNIFTLHNFMDNWVFTPFLILYVLIPPIFCLTKIFFNSNKIDLKSLSILGIFFFLTNIANSNLAYFVSLNIFLFLMILLEYFLYKNNIFQYLKKTVVYYAVSLSMVSFSVVPQVLEMLRQAGNIANSGSSPFDLKQWIIWQAPKFPIPFFIFPTDNLGLYLSHFSPLLLLSSSILITVLVCRSISQEKNKLATIYFALLVMTLFLLNKGNGIVSNEILLRFFNNPALGSLRSWDKTMIFIPFFAIITIAIQTKEKILPYRMIIYVLLLSTIISTYPFFAGGIISKFGSYRPGKNYLTDKYSSIVKIPQDYIRTSNKLNELEMSARIMRVPYNVINSPGWVNFPAWKQVGVDPTLQFFKMQTVQMNSHGSFGNWAYGKVWNSQKNEESEWVLSLAGMLNSKYLLFHKDVDPQFTKETEGKIKYYEEKSFIYTVDRNQYFDLYEINEKYFLPRFYTPLDIVKSQKKLESLPEILTEFKERQAIFLSFQNKNKSAYEKLPEKIESTPMLEIKKISPVKHRVKIHGAKSIFPLVFSETYHDGWKAYLVASRQSPVASIKDINSKYKIFDGNGRDQATKEELVDYINRGLITGLGNEKSKEKKHFLYTEDYSEKVSYTEKYNFNFISKEFKGTIQNDNLKDGHIYETWFKGSLSDNNHLVTNGYANSWLIDPEKQCRASECIKNADGTYEMEFVIEFWPQRLFYLGLVLTGGLLLICIFYLVYVYRKK